MKLGIFNYTDSSGGAARASYRIHKSLIEQGVDSTFFVSKKTLKDKNIKCNPYLAEEISLIFRQKISSLLMKIFSKNSDDYNSLSLISSFWPKYINHLNIDIVHLNWINAEMLSINDIIKISKPIVWTFHDMWPILGTLHTTTQRDKTINQLNLKNKNKFNFNIDKWTYQRKKKIWTRPFNIVTPSKWLEDCVKNSEFMKDWHVQTIGHPVDTNLWKPISKFEAKKKLGINPNYKIILFGADGGTKSYNKGFDMLSMVINSIDLKDIQVKLCIFGDEKEKLKLSIPIYNFGKIEEDVKLSLIYSAADICVVPSRVESFCQVAAEAQSCGTPVLSFSVGGLIDIIKHEVTGFLVQPFDLDEFAKYLKDYLNGEYNNTEFNKNSRKRVCELFSKTTISKKYINLYKSLK